MASALLFDEPAQLHANAEAIDGLSCACNRCCLVAIMAAESKNRGASASQSIERMRSYFTANSGEVFGRLTWPKILEMPAK